MSIPRSNLNPGSLKVNKNNVNLQGLVDPVIGEFAKFDTTVNGFRALTRDLLTKESYGLVNINQIISVYAPEVDNNDTQAYINDITNQVGVFKDQALDFKNNPGRLRTMVKAIANHEDNTLYYPPDIIDAGIIAEGTFNLTQIKLPGLPSTSSEISIAGLSDITKVDSTTSTSRRPADESTEFSGLPKKKLIQSTTKRDVFEAIRPNSLNKFSAFTYNLTWAILTKDLYNILVSIDTNRSEGSGTINSFYNKLSNSELIIMRSGGANIKNKSEFFQEDFFIKNLKMESIVGMRMDTRGTNVTSISFEVFEPYGVTLMERIYSLANKVQKGNKNYLTQPYILIIEFYGHGENGLPLRLPFTRKIVPFKITNLTFSVNAGGTTYNVEAIPYNEVANTIRHGKFDTDQTLMAETIGEALETGSTFLKKEIQVNQTVSLVDANDAGGNFTRETKTVDVVYKIDNEPIKGIAGVLNAEQNFKKEEGYQEFADRYSIQIDKTWDPNFRISKIIKNQTTTNKQQNTTVVLGKSESIKAKSVLKNETKLPNQKKININAGANIFDMITKIINMSDYLNRQYGPGKEGEKTIKTPLKFYKITPHIKLGEFDRCRNDYSKEITFFIKPFKIGSSNYTYANVKDEIIIVKEYNYIFTGKNTEVLNFDIQFNAAYFETRTVATESKINNEGKMVQQKTQKKKTQTKYNELNNKCQSVLSRTPTVIHPTIQSGAPGAPDSDTSEQHQSRSLFESLMKGAKGDLVSLDLNIMGDPDYLFQHSYFAPIAPNPEVIYDPTTGSIQTDDTEIFLRMKLRTPTDLNEKTGTVDFNKKFTTNQSKGVTSAMFNGMYKITQVAHDFSDGVFTQTISCFRVYDQVEDTKDQPVTTSPTLRPKPEPKISARFGEDFGGLDDGGEDSIAIFREDFGGQENNSSDDLLSEGTLRTQKVIDRSASQNPLNDL